MLSRIRETLKPFLPGGQTEPAKRKRQSEGSDIPPMPEKRLRTDDSPARKPTILLKKVATWVVNKHRSFTENYYVRQITGSPKAVMKKLSGLSNQGQGEMPANRQPFLQPGIHLDHGSDVRYGREIMSAMQGIQIHSTPVNNPAKGYSFTDANFDLDQPDVFSFVGSSNRKIQFQGDSSLQPRIQDVDASSGQELTRPPIRSQYGVTYENQVLATGKGPGYKSIYDKVFSGQGKPRRRFHGHHYRSKIAVRESIRMEERTRYAELIQQFTTAPVINRAYNPFSAQKSIINSSKKTRDNETVLGTEVIDIGPDQLSDRTQSSISSRTDSIKVHAKQMQQSKSVVGARQHLASLASGVASRDTLHPDPITIDLTEAGESSNQTAASSSSNQTLCSNSNQTASSTEAFSAENLSPRGRRKWSQSRSLSPSNSLNGFTRSIQDSKYIRDDWLQDMLEKITLESKDLKSKAEEEEIKVKYYKDKRKHWDEDLEKRIHHRLRLSERAPHVIEETFEEEEEEQAEFPELTDEQEEMVNAALVPYPPDQKIAEGFRLELTRHDIQTLNGLNWLNDEVINFYMNLLMERSEQDGFPKVHAFNTFFYPKIIKSGQQSVRRWTKKVDIFSKDYILVPVHLGMHWCLAVVDFRKKEIRYYDSMGGSNKSCLEALRKYLMDESFEKKKQKFDMSDWKLINVKDVPQQMNGSDCGMFACKFAEYITRDAPITFNQEHMPYFRRRMIYEILTKQLM